MFSLYPLFTPYVQGLLDYTFCSMQVFYSCCLLLSVSRVLLVAKRKQSSIHKGKEMPRVMYTSPFSLGAKTYTPFPAPACSEHGRTPV